MNDKQRLWVHPATFTYRLDPPDRILQTIWCTRSGWGYIRRRDLWVAEECSPEELIRQGYEVMKPLTDGDAHLCPHCFMYIDSIPGNLVRKHVSECAGGGEDWKKMEDIMVQEQRLSRHAKKLRQERLRQQAEQEEAERRERFDRIREENASRQQAKDRKARLKRQTKEELRRR